MQTSEWTAKCCWGGRSEFMWVGGSTSQIPLYVLLHDGVLSGLYLWGYRKVSMNLKEVPLIPLLLKKAFASLLTLNISSLYLLKQKSSF